MVIQGQPPFLKFYPGKIFRSNTVFFHGYTIIDRANQFTEVAAYTFFIFYRVMKLGEPDASGRRSPIDTGETFALNVDMVIKAAGQVPFEKLVNKFKIQNSKGKINIKDSATNIPGVFAGGDCVNGGKEVVDAVQAGKDGAFSILSYLGIKN